MIIKRIGPLSLAKIMGTLYLIMGFILGLIMSALSVFTSAFLCGPAGGSGKGMGIFFGAFAVIALPLLYGALGFIGGLISAFLYNLLARLMGGIEMEIEANEPLAQAQPLPDESAPVV